MKKLLYSALILLFLLTSCTPKETPPKTDGENISENENPVNDETLEPVIYNEFEYKVTTIDWTDLDRLSPEEKAREFLSAICLSDSDVLSMYMQGDTIQELIKVKADAKIADGKEITEYYGEYPYKGYETKVLFEITESGSDLFPVGTYEYILKIMDTSVLSVEYFGASDRYGVNIIPDKQTSPALYDTYAFIDEIFHYNAADLSNAALDVDLHFDSLFHIAIHSLMALHEDYIFKTTLDEFKEYISLRYGYTDNAVLQRFADKLTRVTYASVDENGVYTGSCAHGYSSIIRELKSIEEKDGLVVFSYTMFADSAQMLPCEEVSFTLRKNENNDLMTLVDIKSEKLNSCEVAIVSP